MLKRCYKEKGLNYGVWIGFFVKVYIMKWWSWKFDLDINFVGYMIKCEDWWIDYWSF